MSVTFFTYVWHYLLARTLYDELLRPTSHGSPRGVLLLACLGGLVIFLARRRRRRRRA